MEGTRCMLYVREGCKTKGGENLHVPPIYLLSTHSASAVFDVRYVDCRTRVSAYPRTLCMYIGVLGSPRYPHDSRAELPKLKVSRLMQSVRIFSVTKVEGWQNNTWYYSSTSTCLAVSFRISPSSLSVYVHQQFSQLSYAINPSSAVSAFAPLLYTKYTTSSCCPIIYE